MKLSICKIRVVTRSPERMNIKFCKKYHKVSINYGKGAPNMKWAYTSIAKLGGFTVTVHQPLLTIIVAILLGSKLPLERSFFGVIM